MPYKENVREFVPPPGQTFPIAAGGVTHQLRTDEFHTGLLALLGSDDLDVEVQGILSTDPGKATQFNWLTKESGVEKGFTPLDPLPSLIRLKVVTGTLTAAQISLANDPATSFASQISASAKVSAEAASAAANLAPIPPPPQLPPSLWEKFGIVMPPVITSEGHYWVGRFRLYRVSRARWMEQQAEAHQLANSGMMAPNPNNFNDEGSQFGRATVDLDAMFGRR